MRISGICFTQEGFKVIQKIDRIFSRWDADIEISWYGKGKYLQDAADFPIKKVEEPIQQWTEKHFYNDNGLIFVGATGIAVRAIAPFVRDKRTDPAVIVLDERARFCISLLSGHIGGANALVKELALMLNSVPVITTATDVSSRFAVDVFARQNKMEISSMTYAKEVSAALLGGESVGFISDFPVEDELPKGIVWHDKLNRAMGDIADSSEDGTSIGINISTSFRRAPFDHTLWLIPRCVTLGIGCRKGTPVSEIRRVVHKVLNDHCIYPESVAAIASIDLKKEEEGLLQFCEEMGVALTTYTAEELLSVEGDFTSSEFVQSITGVDNVCERSAMYGNGKRIYVRKYAENGVTCAAAIEDIAINFETAEE